MGWFDDVRWSEIFMPDQPILEIIVRGSIIYLSLFLLLRFVLKRQAGSVGISDLLVIVLLADAAQNGMASDYHSLADGIVLVITLVFWNVTLEWLGFHLPWFEKLLHASPYLLIKHGRMLYRNMKRELITEEELMSQLRLQGIETIDKVKKACLEGDGKISFIEYKPGEKRHHPRNAIV